MQKIMRMDSIPLKNTYFTAEGYFRDEPIVTSVGIFEYKESDGSIRRELRLPEHVFSTDSLASYSGKPIIITHNAGCIDKENVKREYVGTMLSDGYRDGDDVRVKIVIHDIDRVKGTKDRELSLGYSLDLDETPGVWKGIKYDAIQKNIRINHLAIVENARAGEQARLNLDGKTNDSHNNNILIGGKVMQKQPRGLTAEELDAAVETYKKSLETKADAEDVEEPIENNDGKGKTPADIIAEVRERQENRKDEELADVVMHQDEDIDMLIATLEKLIAEIKDVNGDAADEEEPEEMPADNNDSEEEVIVEDSDDFSSEAETEVEVKGDSCGKNDSCGRKDSADEIVRKKVQICRIGDKLNMDGLENLSIMDGRRAIINHVNPNIRLDGRSDTYINAMFDLMVNDINEKKNVDYQRTQASKRNDSADNEPMTLAERARAEMMNREGI